MLRFILFLSIACNVMLTGAIAAYMFHQPTIVQALPAVLRPPVPEQGRMHMLSQAARALPEKKSTKVSKIIHTLHDNIQGRRQNIRDLKRRVKHLLGEFPLPDDAILAAHAQMQQDRSGISDDIIRGLLDIAAELNAEERRRFINATFPGRKGDRYHKEEKILLEGAMSMSPDRVKHEPFDMLQHGRSTDASQTTTPDASESFPHTPAP